VTGRRRKLHNEEVSDSYPSPSIIRINKSRIVGWLGHVAPVGRKGTHVGC
jgi:hypothetical protein